MQKFIYAIFDKKSELFNPPFIESTDGTAVRAITDLMVKQAESVFATYAEDYSLHKVGVWNDQTGNPESLMEGHTEKIVELKSLLQPKKE